jgi:hypothetical protein
MNNSQNIHEDISTKLAWMKPDLTILSVSDNTLGGGAGSDDGFAGLS